MNDNENKKFIARSINWGNIIGLLIPFLLLIITGYASLVSTISTLKEQIIEIQNDRKEDTEKQRIDIKENKKYIDDLREKERQDAINIAKVSK